MSHARFPDDAAAPAMSVLRGRVVTPDTVLDDGLVVVVGQRLGWVGDVRRAPAVFTPPAPSGPRRTLLPGLVDLHCHGGGGASFPDATDAATARVAAREHLRHGTTSLVASLVTADVAVLLQRTSVLAGLADDGDLAGIHLEGPFLSPARCGAQDPTLMTDGRAGVVRDVAAAARGHLVAMTVAPEVPGVLGPDGVLAALVDAGALPSIGHTDATEERTSEALAAAWAALARDGSRSRRPTLTHLFNGMRPLHHRDPGPVAAGLAAAARGQAVVELVADGVHLADGTVRALFDLVGAEAIALVTDAMAAAGMPDGRYALGPVQVDVVGGVARRTGSDTIAGGTAHLLDVVRCTVRSGVPLAAAVRAAATTPAAVLGRADIGALEAGRRADLVMVDDDLRPLRVMRAGAWLDGQ